MLDEALLIKYEKLKKYIKSFDKVVVAYSAGVDSTFLLYAANEALGKGVIAVTARSHLIPTTEVEETQRFCQKLGITQIVMEFDEMKVEKFSSNPPDRCYYCKKKIFENIRKIARENEITTVVEGSNLDDDKDYRPGHKAIEELGIISPLRLCGLTKNDIRQISKELGIPTWDKPSFACLASRIPYGETITVDKLEKVDEAEEILRKLYFKQFRVRLHGNVARIELPEKDFDRFMEKDIRIMVHKEFKKIGFSYVALDILGYRSGSLNETLKA